MARLYAGILGPLAFVVCVANGVIARGGAETVLWNAWCHLMAFAAIGAVIGWLAERIVDDGVLGQLAAEVTEQQPQQASPPAQPGAATVGQ